MCERVLFLDAIVYTDAIKSTIRQVLCFHIKYWRFWNFAFLFQMYFTETYVN
jgi:hypothetical protein